LGRSALGLSCGSVVDVAVDMPGSCFDDKDYLNNRYHAKRVLYLDSLRVALAGKTAAGSRRERQERQERKTGKGRTRARARQMGIWRGTQVVGRRCCGWSGMRRWWILESRC
jgi:hypothetical protein